MANTYEMHTRWLVDLGLDDMWDLVEERLSSSDPMPWWDSLTTVSNDGRELYLAARSPIGYSLHFRIHDLVTERPQRLSYASDGDLRGRGTTIFHAVDAHSCALDFTWNVDLDRVWMRATSRALRPLFVLGHDLVMAQGERNLNRWIATQARA